MAIEYRHVIKVSFEVDMFHPTKLDEPEAVALFKDMLPQLIQEDPYFVDDMNVSLYWSLPHGSKEELRDLLG